MAQKTRKLHRHFGGNPPRSTIIRNVIKGLRPVPALPKRNAFGKLIKTRRNRRT
jgi:hypothetical protein